MITITITATIKVRNLPAQLLEQFVADNSFANPKYDQLKRMGFWTGSTEPIIWLYQLVDGVLTLPRGYLPATIHQIKAAGVPFTIDDKTVCPPAESSPPGGELYPFQARALENLLRYPTGVMEAPTGCGKTCMLLSAIPKLKTNTLILTHTSELLAQTMERVESWLGIEPGVIGGGKEDIQPITVAMIQTLARRDLEESGIADYFGAVMVDEAHHSPAITWSRILEQLPARYKFGFTATAWRKDGLHFLMWRLIGSRTAKITSQEAEAAGKIVRPAVEVVPTNYHYPLKDADEWTAMITDLVRDQEGTFSSCKKSASAFPLTPKP